MPAATQKKSSGVGIILLVIGLLLVLGGGGYFGFTKWQASRKAARDAAIASQSAPPATAPAPTPIPQAETPVQVAPPVQTTPAPASPYTPPKAPKKAESKSPPPGPAPANPTPLPSTPVETAPPNRTEPAPTSPATAATPLSPEPAGPVPVTHPNVIKQVKPVYPPIARQTRIGGIVRVEVIIGVNGRVRSAKQVSGNAVLGPAAVDAVKQWIYEPTMVNGHAVEAITTVQFDFKLE